MEASVPTGRRTRPSSVQNSIGLLGAFAGLCTLFALIVSVADGVRETTQKSWPQATATIENCSVEPHVPLRRHGAVWQIQCRIHYRADSDEIEASIGSRNTTSGSGGDAEGMRRWVARHRSGSQLVVHYNPGDHKEAVLPPLTCPTRGHERPTTSGSC
jgi:hypothetical protein